MRPATRVGDSVCHVPAGGLAVARRNPGRTRHRGAARRGGRTSLSDPLTVIAGTVMFAVIYFAIGVTVRALTKSEANGSLIVIFIWMFDVFLGAEHSSCLCAVS